jgi:hypothetical protein
MAGFARVNGFGNFIIPTLYGTSDIVAYIVTVCSTSTGANTAVDLRALDDGADEAMENLMREFNPIMYQGKNAADGIIYLIMHGHNVSAASIKSRIVALGYGTDTTVTLGTAITVA